MGKKAPVKRPVLAQLLAQLTESRGRNTRVGEIYTSKEDPGRTCSQSGEADEMWVSCHSPLPRPGSFRCKEEVLGSAEEARTTLFG